jgi:hypothetical protein
MLENKNTEGDKQLQMKEQELKENHVKDGGISLKRIFIYNGILHTSLPLCA